MPEGLSLSVRAQSARRFTRQEGEGMGLWRAAVPRRTRKSLAVAGAVLATAAIAAAPAKADNGKVLVFTGTAGTANPVSTTAANAITALGAANSFTVDTSSSAADINAAKLAGYKAVVFVNSSGDVLSDASETDLQNYVQNG